MSEDRASYETTALAGAAERMCVCGHPESDHDAEPPFVGCMAEAPHDGLRFCECEMFRPAQRQCLQGLNMVPCPVDRLTRQREALKAAVREVDDRLRRILDEAWDEADGHKAEVERLRGAAGYVVDVLDGYFNRHIPTDTLMLHSCMETLRAALAGEKGESDAGR